MLTLFQAAVLVDFFCVAFAAGLAQLVLRVRPLPYFRAWAALSTWGVLLNGALTTIPFVGPGQLNFFVATVGSTGVSWWQTRFACELTGRQFPRRTAGVAIGGSLVLCGIIALAGGEFSAATIPAVFACMATRALLAATLIEAGRDPAQRGLRWLGAVVLAHGLWMLLFPVAMGTEWVWAGHLVDAAFELSASVGFATWALARTLRDLKEAARLKHRFLEAAAVEFRAPLATIARNVTQLEAETSGLPVAYVAQLRRGADRLARMVDEMLDAARVEAGAYTLDLMPTDVGAILLDEAEALAPQAREAGVRLVVAPTPELWVAADPARVSQVLVNLLANALKFTPPNGEVCVSVQTVRGFVRVEVADSGIGIAPADIPRLFDRFFQVQRGQRRGGTGLGLAISKALVEAHGGEIGARARPGGGSVFWFTLPLGPAA